MIIVHDILRARENIADFIQQTPIIHSTPLSEVCGNQMYVKGEHLQKTGSFKIRGATNKVKQAFRTDETFITAASNGNHGIAVAYIANQLGLPSTIVLPIDASDSKQNKIKTYGGTIEKCGTTSTERHSRAKELAQKHDGLFIHPYNDPFIMAGQGTIGLEIIDQLENVDVIVVPIGGGGLIAGILTAIKHTKPKVKVIGVEPEMANVMFLSLQNNKITEIPETTTIADCLRTSRPGGMTFPIVKEYIDDVVLVSEEEIKLAQSFVLERMEQRIEPSSAVTVAAAMNEKLAVKDKNVVCVLTGGNMDLEML